MGVPDLSKNPQAGNNVFMNVGLAITHMPEPLLYCINGLILLLLSALMRRLQPGSDKAKTANDSYSLPVRIRSRRVVSIDRQKTRKPEPALALRSAGNF